MTLGKVRLEPLRSRLLIVAGVLVFAALTVVRVWSPGRLGWWALASFGSFVAAEVGIWAVLSLVVWRHRRQPARFVATRTSFGVQPEVPPGVVPVLLIGLVAMQFGMAVAAWRVPEPDPVVVVMSYGFLGGMCIVGVAEAAATVVTTRTAWHGFAVELTPAGIRSREGWLYRFIPWEALASGGPARPPRKARRLTSSLSGPT